MGEYDLDGWTVAGPHQPRPTSTASCHEHTATTLLTPHKAPCVVTAGTFDGVHCGHRALLAHAAREARRAGCPAHRRDVLAAAGRGPAAAWAARPVLAARARRAARSAPAPMTWSSSRSVARSWGCRRRSSSRISPRTSTCRRCASVRTSRSVEGARATCRRLRALGVEVDQRAARPRGGRAREDLVLGVARTPRPRDVLAHGGGPCRLSSWSPRPTCGATLGRFATGVTVVSTERDGEIHAMTANAFTSVSLDPPLVLVSIDHRAKMHQLLPDTKRFGVSVLGCDQERVAWHFAGRPLAAPGELFAADGDVPLVAGAIAHVGCSLHACHQAGDHTLYLGLRRAPGQPAGRAAAVPPRRVRRASHRTRTWSTHGAGSGPACD